MSIVDPLPGLRGEARANHVAAMFARVSGKYDLLNTVMTGGMHHRWRRQAALLGTRDLAGVALDVATGTGDLAIALARRPGICQVVGLDFVPEMLHLARRKVLRRSPSKAIGFLQGDAMALPFPDDAFTCATCCFGLRNMEDVPKALAEMARVVERGGRVVIIEIVPAESKGLLLWLLDVYFRRVVPVLGRVLAGEREAYTYLPRSVDAFPLAGELVHLMEKAGLRNVTYRNAGMGMVAIHVGEKA
ncbi:MAG: bifunctional demethylmenaquinone methyltransferase/2-methoxy-6-polyprenyl-1,4-benzoquinol methylase UbiE [Dehalococcoidia bacterium]|nr:bifunctional demethylmenaquinone methyltransferase/2-methoxy-6-polyprenyl-1,4-benzoquinol methylase UbiE [Dehalococcoidia bacterium]